MSYHKVAVVTGSNKGLGFAIVRALCKDYDGVVYLTSRNTDLGEEAVKKLKSKNLEAKYHQLDICDNDSVNCLKEYMVTNYGGIDVLVNNAGVSFRKNSTMPYTEQVRVTVGTNFTATLNACNILLPIIKKNGRVVTISSALGKVALKKCSNKLQAEFRSNKITEQELVQKMDEFVEYAVNKIPEEDSYPNLAYRTSKLGVTVMTRIQARLFREQGKNDILINCCCPGWVRSDMTGPEATKSPDEGAETPVYLTLLPTGTTEPNGQFLQNKKITEW